MIIVDASVLANALTDDGQYGKVARQQLTIDPRWAGPEHLLVEVFAALRGRVFGGKLGESRARHALGSLAGAAIQQMSVAPLLPRMWELRNDISGYDAAYVAVAEACECALVTADLRLARAVSPRCEIRLGAPLDD